jgi:hypothetical protein
MPWFPVSHAQRRILDSSARGGTEGEDIISLSAQNHVGAVSLTNGGELVGRSVGFRPALRPDGALSKPREL